MASTRERTENFEDMSTTGWPADLCSLRVVAAQAWSVWAELEYTAREAVGEERGELISMAGDAYKLVKQLRAFGVRQLALREQHENEQYEAEQAKRAVEGTGDGAKLGDLRVAYVKGGDFPYGVEEYAHSTLRKRSAWRTVMSPYDDSQALRFMSQGEAEQWIHERSAPDPNPEPDTQEAGKEPAPAAGAIYFCVDCGDSTFAGPDAQTYADYPVCPNCGSRNGVGKSLGGIPVAPERPTFAGDGTPANESDIGF